MPADILLSVLIPAVPSRANQAGELFARLIEQAEEYPVEVLMLHDNKRRTTGMKRQALLDISRGLFVAYVDDDDDVADNYIFELLHAITMHPDCDCIVHDVLCFINDDPPVVCRHGIEYENTPLTADGATRKPWHTCAYRCDIAKSARFSDKQNGEDWDWIKQIWPKVKNQVKIDSVIYHYKWSQEMTETQ